MSKSTQLNIVYYHSEIKIYSYTNDLPGCCRVNPDKSVGQVKNN